MPAEYDLIILGGGCAGLSVAMRLSELGERCPRTLIIESRTQYTNDRTWCFWDDGSTRMRHLIRHSWQNMRIQTAGRCITLDCGSTPYQMLPADAFYAEALRMLAQSERMELMLGASVISEPDKLGEKWQIETSAGLHRGRLVIDTRPVRNIRQIESTLWQSFSGHEIECNAAVFDPTCTDLMDFSLGDPTRIAFAYVLPVSRNRALVEATVFGTDPIDCGGLALDLDIAIAGRVNGATFNILRSENGILPMGLAPPAIGSDDSYVRAGLTSGGARPSTGYAFQRIQRWADACAKRMGEGGLPMGHAADPLPLRAMDHLFLSVLRARPETAPSLFLSLFEKTDIARVVRFLSDRGTLLDLAIIASVLPVLPFIQEIPGALMRFAQPRRGVLSQ